ncbi:hypothetical protein SLEP1_g5239 [Rubroshorea leprosula]|uniref:Uncharacterized protein n=1 Tax=Rubroshorea leprosula TaxID=152421 RepID=A0AAV5HZE3_9ROSI|nr:hypothetical protein SLEP1_g5239 [Rubroshorea leprosula]
MPSSSTYILFFLLSPRLRCFLLGVCVCGYGVSGPKLKAWGIQWTLRGI